MDITGECVLCIYGDELDFDSIRENMDISPSKIIHKGERITSKKAAPKDLWSYKKIMNKDSDFCSTLKDIVSELVNKREYLEKMNSENNEVIISCYIRSDMGQMGFSLDTETIELLYKLGLRIDVHILSFGMADNEL